MAKLNIQYLVIAILLILVILSIVQAVQINNLQERVDVVNAENAGSEVEPKAELADDVQQPALLVGAINTLIA